MLHPIFIVRDGRPLGWALTGRTPLKTRHLAANLYMSCAYWTPSHDTVFVDCIAAWVEADSETQDVWKIFRGTPPPLGWDPREWPATAPSTGAARSSRRCGSSPGGAVMAGAEYPHGRLTGRVWRDERARRRLLRERERRGCMTSSQSRTQACGSGQRRWRPYLRPRARRA
jgi:hypothetical protein